MIKFLLRLIVNLIVALIVGGISYVVVGVVTAGEALVNYWVIVRVVFIIFTVIDILGIAKKAVDSTMDNNTYF